MSRNALYLAIVACVVSATLGWGIGVVMNPRVNTIAVRAWLDSRDLQAHAETERQVTEARDACRVEVARTRAGLTEVNENAIAVMLEERKQYSERIAGLRAQLMAAGVQERIERP